MEITAGDNKGNQISILQNDQVVDITPSGENFINIHKTCFDSFDVENDIIELRNGGNDGVRISINLISKGVKTQLLFGKNENSIWVALDKDNDRCKSAEEMEAEGMGAGRLDGEISSFIKIRNGEVIQSACVGK